LPAGDRGGRIVAKRDGALARTCTRAGNVKHGDRTVLSSYEAVTCTADVEVGSDDGSWRVDGLGAGALTGACARTRHVERSNGAVLTPEKAVDHVASIRVLSGDHSLWVDVLGQSALAGACARARSVERGYGAVVWSPQKTVIHTARVDVGSRDRPCQGKSTDE